MMALSLWLGVVLFSAILYLTGSYWKAILIGTPPSSPRARPPSAPTPPMRLHCLDHPFRRQTPDGIVVVVRCRFILRNTLSQRVLLESPSGWHVRFGCTGCCYARR